MKRIRKSAIFFEIYFHALNNFQTGQKPYERIIRQPNITLKN